MKKIVVCLAALALASPVHAAIEPYQHDEGAIVKVLCNEGSGTATRVGKNTYISVDHVTRNTGCTVNGTPIMVTYADPRKDFSTFLGPSGSETIAISCKGFKSGEAYISRGYAFGGPDVWFEPVVAVTKYKGFWAFAGHHFPGMSGGPILDSEGKTTGTVNILNPTGGLDLSETPVCQ